MTKSKNQQRDEATVNVDAIVSRLYIAREERKKARIALREAGERLGECQELDCYRNGTPCYELNNIEMWCDTCKEKQPIWEKAQKASREAGEALRAVLRYGKSLVG